jgi:hypothetical protein
MSNFKQDQIAQRTAVERAEREAREKRSWFKFLEKHREVQPVTANFQITVDYFNGQELTAEDLESAYENPGFRKQLAMITPERDRASLEADYYELIAGSIEMRKEMLSRTKYWDIEVLRKAVEDLTERKTLSKMSTQELKTLVRPAPLTRSALPLEHTKQSLLAMSGPALRALIARYGSDAITARMQNRG